MPRPALLLLFILTGPLLAEETAITDEELQPVELEFRKAVVSVRKGELKPEQLVQHYALEVERADSKRGKAIARFLYGRVLQLLDRHSEAQVEFDGAVALWPGFPAAYVALAGLAGGARDYGRAQELAKKALALDPEYLPAIILLGDLALAQGNFKEALRFFQESIEIRPTADGCQGLARACIKLFEETYLEEEKEAYASRALAAANGLVQMHPESGQARLFHANVLHSLGRTEQAIDALEKSYDAVTDEGFRLRCLFTLLVFYEDQRELDKVMEVLERLLARPDLEPQDRATLEEQLKVLQTSGAAGFFVMRIKGFLKLLENPGISPSDRRGILRLLLGILNDERVVSDPAFEAVRDEILKRCIRILATAPPPELMLEMMGFFRRSLPDPQLIRILVWYVYPQGGENKTPEVRAEAVRTIAALNGIGALPTLLHCLKDDSGQVAREVDKALSRLFGVRSMAGGDGMSPLTPEELTRARLGWRAHALTEEGAEKLAQGIAALRKSVVMDPGHNRLQKGNPLADQLVSVLLLDDDMRWEPWVAGYDFLAAYMGTEGFRPPELRGKPVARGQRAAIVKRIQSYWSGAPGTKLEEDEEGGDEPG